MSTSRINKLGNLQRRDHVLIDLAIHLERGNRVQQGAPAIVIRRPALALVFRHQGLVFDIENSCGIVGPLQESAQANEAQRFVLQHGADGDARDRCERYFTHSVKKASMPVLPSPGVKLRILSQQALVVSHSSLVSVPRTACAFSRVAPAASDARGLASSKIM